MVKKVLSVGLEALSYSATWLAGVILVVYIGAYVLVKNDPVQAQGSRVTSIQAVPVVSEAMTVDGTAGGFAAGTLTTITARLRGIRTDGVVCIGTLETAAIRFTLEGTTPTSTVGHPLAVDQQLRIDGLSSVTGFSAIRTTGTSGDIFWTCYV